MKNIKIKEEMKEKFRRIKENKLLILGVLIGIIGSLIAGVVNDLIKEYPVYPWAYLFILSIILLIIVFKFLQEYIKLKIQLYRMKKLIKKAKKF